VARELTTTDLRRGLVDRRRELSVAAMFARFTTPIRMSPRSAVNTDGKDAVWNVHDGDAPCGC
jgi:hypothetical protein